MAYTYLYLRKEVKRKINFKPQELREVPCFLEIETLGRRASMGEVVGFNVKAFEL